MNVFYLSHDPIEAAHFHHFTHASTMIKEYAQLMSTAHRILDGSYEDVVEYQGKKMRIKKQYIVSDRVLNNTLYKATHMNHPCAKWVRESVYNYAWIYLAYAALGERFLKYRNKHHKSYLNLADALSAFPKNIPHAPFTDPPACMDDEHVIEGDVVASYRNCYVKTKMFSYWEHGDVPWWVPEKYH